MCATYQKTALRKIEDIAGQYSGSVRQRMGDLAVSKCTALIKYTIK